MYSEDRILRISPDSNTNGLSEFEDLLGVTSIDCNTNGIPDECEADFDGDGLIDDCDPDIDEDGVANNDDVCDFTPLAASIEPDGGILGDLDDDCDVDLID